MATTEEEINSSCSADCETSGIFLCLPCDTDGKKLEAVKYCVNCDLHLCSACVKHHFLLPILRRHVLTDKIQMSSVEGRNNRCHEHKNLTIEYHCPSHDFLGCHLCFYQHQKTCKDSLHIPEVAGTLTNSEEFKEFTAKLDRVNTNANTVILKANQNTEPVETNTAEQIAAVKAYKLQIVKAAEQLENDLIYKLECLKETELTKCKTVIDECTKIREESMAISAEVKMLQNKSLNTDLYVSMVKSKDKLTSLENDITTLESNSSASSVTFKGNDQLLDLRKNPWGLGRFVSSGDIYSAQHVRDIDVKTEGDSSNCLIRGSAVLSGGQLVIGDYNNKKVKLVDTKNNKVVSELKLSNGPWSVAAVTATTVAVTVPDDKKIVLVRTTPPLSVDREVGTKEDCHGVAYLNGKLVVTYWLGNKVEVMDLQGVVLHEIKADANGKDLFVYPHTVAVNPGYNVMYVSNIVRGSYVLCLKLDGTVVATYKDSELQSPSQAAVDSNGMVLVCGHDSQNVHLITPDCKKVKVLLFSTYPETISYDENSRNLYVGTNGNNLTMFHVEYTPL